MGVTKGYEKGVHVMQSSSPIPWLTEDMIQLKFVGKGLFANGMRNCLKDNTEHQGYKVCVVHARSHKHFGVGNSSSMVLMKSDKVEQMRIPCKEHKAGYYKHHIRRVLTTVVYVIARNVGVPSQARPEVMSRKDLDRKYNKY